MQAIQNDILICNKSRLADEVSIELLHNYKERTFLIWNNKGRNSYYH